MVFMISNRSPDLIKKLLTLVNEINCKTLKFDEMSNEILRAALSTYKLTQYVSQTINV